MDWIAIGKRIRQQREYMGLTREQFAWKTFFLVGSSGNPSTRFTRLG